MTTQVITPPACIESELIRIWESVDKTQKMRASLFNLIVFNQLSQRTDYIRGIVQKIIDTFPCRVLFISHDPDPSKNYLKTAVSVMSCKNAAICDDIDVGVAGSDWERVPYVILPHILPDLPVYLLWADSPHLNHPLFQPLSSLAHRVIFDSESADNLHSFSSILLAIKDHKNCDVADLNWGRIEGWRDLLASTFDSKERHAHLKEIAEVRLVYNARETEYFCHLKIQAMYLLSLFSSRLGWDFLSVDRIGNSYHFFFQNEVRALIEPALLPELSPGTLLSLDVTTKTHILYQFTRTPKLPHQIIVQISTPERCELPYRFILRKSPMGQSLVREIFLKGTSPFFLQTLRQLTVLDKEKIC